MSRHPEVKWAETTEKIFLTVESKINIGERNIFCIIEKAEPERWNKLLRVGKPPHYVKVDWDKWVDEDVEGSSGAADMDMGGMDFSNFGGPGGMGGLEGLGGMGGLGGMPGQGDMGGGMGGLDEYEDSDDEEETAKSGEKKDDEKEEAPATEKAKTEEQTSSVKEDK